MDQIGIGIEVMGYGLAGVFSFLIIFFFTIKALLFLFPDKSEEEKSDTAQ
jgi:Na+-transporting methylmalonyl-CoA/oxaloacetate decarboxylase gamma subunit